MKTKRFPILTPAEVRELFQVVVRGGGDPWPRRRLGLVGSLLIVAMDMTFAAVLVRILVSEDLLIDVLYVVAIDTARLMLVVALLFWFVARLGDPPAGFGIRPSAFKEEIRWSLRFVLTGVVLVVAVGVLGSAAWLLGGSRLPAPPLALTDLLDDGSVAESLALLLALAFLGGVSAPLLEETIYRGVLLPPLLRLLPRPAAIALGAAVFAFLHAVPYGHGGIGLVQFFGGLLLGVTFVARRSILAAVIVHAAGNGCLAAAHMFHAQLYEWCPALFS